jgi:hypothetical protein
MTAIDFTPTAYSRGLGAASATATRVAGETVVCDMCGCRLTTRQTADDDGFTGARTWFHFAGAAGHDARGCAVSCVEAAHTIA